MKIVIMRTIVLSILIIITISCNYNVVNTKELEENVRKLGEAAYFEGQADAINGKYCIKFTNDSCWVWIASPWSDGTVPTYNISVIHSSINYKK